MEGRTRKDITEAEYEALVAKDKELAARVTELEKKVAELEYKLTIYTRKDC